MKPEARRRNASVLVESVGHKWEGKTSELAAGKKKSDRAKKSSLLGWVYGGAGTWAGGGEVKGGT